MGLRLRIGPNAFGNALGSSLAASISGDGRTLPRRPISDFSSITPVDPSGPTVNVQELLTGLPESQGSEAFYVAQAAASSQGQPNGNKPFTVYPGGIGANDTGPDRQTTLNYADGTMVPVVTRTTNRMWALGQMELEANQQAGVRDPADILRQANEMAWAPKGTAYDGESVWTTLGLVEAAKRRQDVDPLMTAQLTSAWRDVYQRGAVENVIRPFKTIQGMPAQFKEDAIGAQAFGGASLRGPRPAMNNVLPTTRGSRVAFTSNGKIETQYSNLFPNDAVMPGPRYKLVQNQDGDFRYSMPNGEMRTPKGNYDFVQTDGGIQIAPPRNDYESGHLSLSKGGNVDYAGTIQFSQKGNLKWWNNHSGHYAPPAEGSNVVKLPSNLFIPFDQ